MISKGDFWPLKQLKWSMGLQSERCVLVVDAEFQMSGCRIQKQQDNMAGRYY